MCGPKSMIVVNTASDITTFGFSQYGVAGGLFQVIPALTAEIRKRKGK